MKNADKKAKKFALSILSRVFSFTCKKKCREKKSEFSPENLLGFYISLGVDNNCTVAAVFNYICHVTLYYTHKKTFFRSHIYPWHLKVLIPLTLHNLVVQKNNLRVGAQNRTYPPPPQRVFIFWGLKGREKEKKMPKLDTQENYTQNRENIAKNEDSLGGG